MSIVEKIKENRPNIKETTINSYFQYIKKIYQILNDTTELPKNVNFLNDFEEIDKIMEKYKPNTKKNYYSAIVVALKAYEKDKDLISKYEEVRDEVQTNYDNMTKANKKTDKQKENWVSLEEYDKLIEKYKKEIKIKKYFTIKELNKKGYETLKEYIILLTYRYLPLRNDFANMKILSKRSYDSISKKDKEENNYLVGTKATGFKFYINDYKTKKTFGNKVIDIPEKVEKEIKKYVKQNPTEYFLTDTNRNPITPNGITKLLTKIFQNEYNKNVSSSMIRHIILSEKYGETLEEMKKDSEIMGHGMNMQKDYTKTD
tara:strand:+ start:3543 stop:4490 length:948 start_codon:yes stop_codon:yes gene_type:complete